MIFFDIDGTLIDQRAAERAAAGALLARYAGELPAAWSVEDLCRRWRALRRRHLPGFLAGATPYREYQRRRIRDLFGRSPDDLPDAEADARLETFLAPYRRNWRAFPDVAPAMQALRGLKVGVISNGNSLQQRAKLRRAGLAGLFELTLVSQDLGIAKPRPEIFIAACRLAGRPVCECVHIGDDLRQDAQASRAAGMQAVWLDRSAGAGRAAPPDEPASRAGVPRVGSLLQFSEWLRLARTG